MRKDVLAAGAKKASYAVSGKIDDAIELRNVAPEGTRNEEIPTVKVADVPRKKFIPTKGVLLVRRTEAVNPSGILLTETMEKEKPAEGIVLEVSAGSTVDRGAHIIFGKYSGTEFRLNGETLLLMEEEEVKGFLVDEPKIVKYKPSRFDTTMASRPFAGLPRC